MNRHLFDLRRSFTQRLESRVVAIESAFRHRNLDAIDHSVARLGGEADTSGFMDLREECAALADALQSEARRAQQIAAEWEDPDEWVTAVDWIAISARVEEVRRKADSVLGEFTAE